LKTIITIFILLITLQTVEALTINEINYNPEGNDNNREYLEVITELNLTGFIIQDANSEDILEPLKEINSTYALIVEEGFDYTNINASIYSAGAAIGNNLNNDEDYIIIKNNTEILDVIHYYDYWGADNNGKSLCKLPDLTGSWQECAQTPGSMNSEFMQDYTIKISEFLPNPEGDDNAPMPDGEWIELFNYGTIPIDLTSVILKDNANHKIIISSTTTYNQTIQSNNYLVVYTNGFSGFLNNEDLEKVKLYDPNNNLIEEMSYTDSIEGNSWSKIDNYWKMTKPSPNKENYKEDQEKDSTIEIATIYLGNDNQARFGDNLRVKVDVYKGDETKNVIEAYIERNDKKVSKITKFNIEKKYSENTLTIPIQIIPNCNLKEPEGNYKLIVNGLGTNDKEDIKIEGITKDLCEEIKIIKEQSTSEKIGSENIINEPQSQIISNPIIYESTSEKANKQAIYFFSIALILTLIQSLRKKWKP